MFRVAIGWRGIKAFIVGGALNHHLATPSTASTHMHEHFRDCIQSDVTVSLDKTLQDRICRVSPSHQPIIGLGIMNFTLIIQESQKIMMMQMRICTFWLIRDNVTFRYVKVSHFPLFARYNKPPEAADAEALDPVVQCCLQSMLFLDHRKSLIQPLTTFWTLWLYSLRNMFTVMALQVK